MRGSRYAQPLTGQEAGYLLFAFSLGVVQTSTDAPRHIIYLSPFPPCYLLSIMATRR